MIKMIVTDLDGTLLKSDKSISGFTKDTLHKYRASGLKIVYATGRGGSAEDRAPSSMFDGRIVMNGAVAYGDNRLLYSRLIPMSAARSLLMACDKRGLKAAAEVGKMQYANFDVTAEWSFIKHYQMADFATLSIDAEKLYAVVNDESDVAFLRMHIPDGLYMTVSRDGLAQIMDVEATKSNAIHALARYWGIDMQEVVSFGDDLNDIDMLSQCGTGVAMGNALEAVKKNADFICDTNDNDGMARWLLEHLC